MHAVAKVLSFHSPQRGQLFYIVHAHIARQAESLQIGTVSSKSFYSGIGEPGTIFKLQVAQVNVTCTTLSRSGREEPHMDMCVSKISKIMKRKVLKALE